MVWSVTGLSRFSPQSMQNETATQTAESAMQSSNCIAMTAMHFLKQKLVPAHTYISIYYNEIWHYMFCFAPFRVLSHNSFCQKVPVTGEDALSWPFHRLGAQYLQVRKLCLLAHLWKCLYNYNHNLSAYLSMSAASIRTEQRSLVIETCFSKLAVKPSNTCIICIFIIGSSFWLNTFPPPDLHRVSHITNSWENARHVSTASYCLYMPCACVGKLFTFFCFLILSLYNTVCVVRSHGQLASGSCLSPRRLALPWWSMILMSVYWS